VIREHRLSKIVENAVTVVAAIALRILSRRPFLDRVRTAAVRTRHLIWPSLLTEILQTILPVWQKDLIDALPADHLEASYELRSQGSIHCYR